MKRFRVTFEMETDDADYTGIYGKTYLEQDIEERFDGHNIEVDEL